MAQAKFYVQVHTPEDPENPFTLVFEDIDVALDVARQIDWSFKGYEDERFVSIACEFADAKGFYGHLTYLYWGGPEKKNAPSKIIKEKFDSKIYLINP